MIKARCSKQFLSKLSKPLVPFNIASKAIWWPNMCDKHARLSGVTFLFIYIMSAECNHKFKIITNKV